MRDHVDGPNLWSGTRVGNRIPESATIQYDVIIADDGPAGLSTALFPLHAPPDLEGRALVVEKEVFPREKTCAAAGDYLAHNLSLGPPDFKTPLPPGCAEPPVTPPPPIARTWHR